MTFEQAVTLFEIAAEELRGNHGVLGFRDLESPRIELHINSEELFESMPGEALLKSTSEDYEHYTKAVGKVTYVCLYKKQNTE